MVSTRWSQWSHYDADVRTIVERVQRSVPSMEPQTKRRREGRVVDSPAGSVMPALADQLTDRQIEMLEAVHSADYFVWPRESTAEDVANEMGVSSPTVSNHLRKAENEMLGELLAETERFFSQEGRFGSWYGEKWLGFPCANGFRGFQPGPRCTRYSCANRSRSWNRRRRTRSSGLESRDAAMPSSHDGARRFAGRRHMRSGWNHDGFKTTELPNS